MSTERQLDDQALFQTTGEQRTALLCLHVINTEKGGKSVDI